METKKQIKPVPDVESLRYHGTPESLTMPLEQDGEFEPKVSIIIPVYKREEYLCDCFNSALGQTFKEIEIIIIDKGEQDTARELIDIFERKDKRVVAPHIKNNGYGASCNIGLKMARGKYVFILESDDHISPETIEEMYNFAEAMDADVVKTPYTVFFGNGTHHDCHHRERMTKLLPSDRCFSVKEYGELLEIHASLWSCLYKKSYLDNNNITFVEADGAGYVDVGFRIDTLTKTDKIAWLDNPLYNYRVDSSGSSTNTWNVSEMNTRWREVHEKFVANQEDYDKFYGPYLILDEYLNTVYRGHLEPLTLEEKDEITYNLSFVSADMIESSKTLTQEHKKDLLEFKNRNTQTGTQDAAKDEPNIKIFASYRVDQENEIISNPLIIPVRCGAVYSENNNDTMVGDNTGDNISSKRMTFCELTVQYWAWKNVEADYYGLCHYRRYLSFMDGVSGFIDDHGELIEPRHMSNTVATEYGLMDPCKMSHMIKNYDAIGMCSIDVSQIPTPSGAHHNMYDFWSKGCVNLIAPYVIDKVISLIKERKPEYYDAAIGYFKQNRHRGYNTFILKRELFFELCEFEFDILFELEKELNTKNYSELMSRTPGYIGEILSAIFLYKIEQSQEYSFAERQLVAFTDCQVKKRKTDFLRPAFSANNIPVVFTSSEFNAPYLGVCIDSMARHMSEENNYDIIVLSSDISNKSKGVLKQTLQNRKNVQIRFADASDLISTSNFTINIPGYISLPMNKVFLPWLFPFHNKIVVLDSDLLIQDDIANLLNIDLEGNYLAAVKDVVFQGLLNGKEAGWQDYAYNVLNLSDPYNYVNAGVFVMDLERIRRSLRQDAVMTIAARNDLKLADQDVINIAFDSKIKFLNPKWNYFVKTNQWVSDCISLASRSDFKLYKDSEDFATIIHFANNPKPWGDPTIAMASNWWEIARNSVYYEELLVRLINHQIATTAHVPFYHTEESPLHPTASRPIVRRVADKILPIGTHRRELLKKIIPKGSPQWNFLKKIYRIFKH